MDCAWVHEHEHEQVKPMARRLLESVKQLPMKTRRSMLHTKDAICTFVHDTYSDLFLPSYRFERGRGATQVAQVETLALLR